MEKSATLKLPTQQDYLLDQLECDRHKTNHILHFLISVLSVGFWLIIWLVISSSDTTERNKIHKKYNLPIETDNAGFFMVLLLGFAVSVYLIKS